MDNIFVERLWRSLKYEEVYLNAYATGRRAAGVLGGVGFDLTLASPAPHDQPHARRRASAAGRAPIYCFATLRGPCDDDLSRIIRLRVTRLDPHRAKLESKPHFTDPPKNRGG